MWKIPQARLSFLIREVHIGYPPKPPEASLVWLKDNAVYVKPKCPACSTYSLALNQPRPRAATDGVTIKCSINWQGCWRNTGLKPTKPAIQCANTLCQTRSTGRKNSSQRQWPMQRPGCDWQVKAGLNQQLKFPIKIPVSSLQPDIALWSASARTVIIAELTVPWEEWYSKLAAAFKDYYCQFITCTGHTGGSKCCFSLTLVIKKDWRKVNNGIKNKYQSTVQNDSSANTIIVMEREEVQNRAACEMCMDSSANDQQQIWQSDDWQQQVWQMM